MRFSLGMGWRLTWVFARTSVTTTPYGCGWSCSCRFARRCLKPWETYDRPLLPSCLSAMPLNAALNNREVVQSGFSAQPGWACECGTELWDAEPPPSMKAEFSGCYG